VTESAPTILIVDDEPQNRRLLEALLGPEGYDTVTAATGEAALGLVEASPPDLILLDIMMPGMDGYEVATALKANPLTVGIPIIMVSAQSDRNARLRGLEAGAEDFLTKPVDRGELWLRVRNLLRLKELTDSLHAQSLGLEEQVTARTADLHRMAHYDALTGLPNRTLFYETFQKTLPLALERGWTVALVFIDVDNFKNVNDTLGHAAGDDLLAQLSDRLVTCVRLRDTVGRLGGDEFALILLMDDGTQGAGVVANKIRESLRAPFYLLGHEVTMTASIGITLYPDDATDPEELVRYADTAMYRAKKAGRDTFRFFTAQMNVEVLARLELETALRKAVRDGEFVLHYQPKVHLNSGRVAGVEALIRWERPGHGLVLPAKFIQALEETGLIVRVGSWVIAAACEQIGRWMASSVGPVHVAVNVAGRQFIEGDLEADVIAALERNHIPADLLELELTESSLMENTERTIGTLRNLKERGVHISVDDFGTGYSSLAYLRRFPIHTLKIDLAFVRDITTDPDDAAIALTVIRMAHGLKLDVVAEGVETAAQLAFLRRHRCDQMQGYYFSRPLAVDKLERLLREDARLPVVEEASAPLDTLLLVDDDLVASAALKQVLEPDGYRILCATSAAEAFELMALHAVQVVVCDPHDDMTTGTGFLDRVKDLYPDALRIVLSARTDMAAVIAAINRGAIHRYYTIPWEDSVLRGHVHDAFRHYWMQHDLREERIGGGTTGTVSAPTQPVPASFVRTSSTAAP
jgi:diguanylate cyclase (GGDEF)-like protein